ncbi:MAG: ParA family protein [Solidesulfovibrio sp. DCME]|uniref:ParA family protein n=1 Tax=Solidesulfovibrio sp. DCME TaxID=3447380 RepID=UPI003D0CC57E
MDAHVSGTARIACLNHKGGVGKTTCAVNLAAGLAGAGFRVLAVDVDPQAHLTASFGLHVPPGRDLAAVLGGALPAGEACIALGKLSVLPASSALAEAEMALSRQDAPVTLLREQLEGCAGFDVVLYDCPPHLGPLTRQALGAARGVFVPMTPDFLALQSLAWLMETLGADNGGPGVRGIVLNRFSQRKRLHREVQSAVAGHFPGIPFATCIRENVALAEAPSHGQDIFRYAPASAGAKDFAALCREAAKRLDLAGRARS